MPHVVKNGDEITLYSAGGKDIRLTPLKKLAQEDRLSAKGKIAMLQVSSHIDKMECYACHAVWAPQCYGCHIQIDYSKSEMKPDWVEIAKNANIHGQTPDAVSKENIQNIQDYIISGKIQEERSYLRFEDPPPVVNGDHRISPAIPGCQTTVTVIDKNGKVRLLNHIFKIPHVEGAGAEGQNAIDMAPLQPHTNQFESRSCESCHTNPKAMGFGIEEGKIYNHPDSSFVIDLLDAEGNPIARQIDTQFNSIPNLKHDWSKIIDDSLRQLQTVGHHFSGSRPLNAEELGKLDRRGVCMSCHSTVPEGDLAIDLMSHVGKYANLDIDNEEHQGILNKSIRLSAWIQITLPFLLLFIAAIWFWKRKRSKK
jgi:hypothetical protein